MKKFVIICSMLLIAQSAHAFIDSKHMTSEQFMVNIGYSAEAAKVIGIVSQDPYREPEQEQKPTFKTILKRIDHYIFPVHNADMDFYNHSGHYNGPHWSDY